MSYEPKPGDGALFTNTHKSKDTHPDRTGYVIAHRDIKAGEKLNLAGRIKEGGGGGKFLSLRLSDIRGREKDQPKSEPNDDTPF